MNSKIAFKVARSILVICGFVGLCGAGARAASTEEVLHSFGAAGDGANPQAGVAFDTRGNLYGVTVNGGTGNCNMGIPCGIIFQLMPGQNGSWTENVVHVFNGQDGGFDPNPVIFDRRGSLYGASPCAYQDCFLFVGGNVFQLTPGSDGNWTFRVIVNFTYPGAYPSGLGFDGSGRLYGTNANGGSAGQGVAFLLGRVSVTGWFEIAAHNFLGAPADGSDPTGALAFDAGGDIYGVTFDGGSSNNGAIYRLSPNRSSFGWRETVLYNFTGGNDGSQPNGVILDSSGNLYGTTSRGGANGLGTVFKLAPNPDGTWTETVLHSFTGSSDGARPKSAPIFDPAGNLYGTTLQGGPSNSGTVYKLVLSGSQWQESVLYSFTGGQDGGSPYGAVILDGAGNIFGTTYSGGAYNGGVAFEITP